MKTIIKKILKAIGLFGPAKKILGNLGLISGHGHELLLRHLRKDRRRLGNAMAHRWLVEVGSTREELPGQGSTASLAAFSAEVGLEFTTIDMDPENTRRARETLKKYDPAFEAVNMKGEDFLYQVSKKVQYCYLDAFDIDHGAHSEKRKQSYQENLGVGITDEFCHQMHLECAKALNKNMSEGGIVVFDDCWRDEYGWQGKGKTAVPFLLSNGFAVISEARNAVALKRGS